MEPSRERRTLAARVAACLAVIIGIRDILWPDTPPPDGATVRRRLFSFLSARSREAPRRGRGAYLRRFIEHVRKVTRSYAKGLFHCYDDPRVPHTSNDLESLNGRGKDNLRRCAGRTSTANGPGSSCGRTYMFAVALNAHIERAELDLMLRRVDPEEYARARALIEAIREPAYRRRAFLRKPEEHLADILARWKGP
jgi:hypothetical protein